MDVEVWFVNNLNREKIYARELARIVRRFFYLDFCNDMICSKIITYRITSFNFGVYFMHVFNL